jgi:hypothetical protein
MSLRRLGFCIIAAWWFVVITTASANAQSYQADLKGIASSLIAKLEAANQHSGTVLDFTNLEGTTTDLGRSLAHELEDKLVESSKTMSFIDRANVDYLLRENKLSAEGLVNPDTSRKLGNLIGVDTVITGTITPLGGQSVRLSVRAVSIETGKIIAVQSATLSAILDPGQSSTLVRPPASSEPTQSSGMTVPAQVSSAERECDALAASTGDHQRPPGVQGIIDDRFDGARAEAACAHAVAEHPAPRLYFELGRALAAEGHYSDAMVNYRLASDQGYAVAYNGIGVLYSEGQGVPQSDAEAARYFRLAAERGSPAGQYNLSRIYLFGRGVPQSDLEAARLVRPAANQGYPLAENNLGWCYEHGRGLPMSQTDAIY